ncbi:Mobile element protein [Methanosarcina mazei Tuc01]|uniref:Mobile element protein n=1 Tax=Methanosarcina mazei Tuc01 TaxID=1236903 RepID=M1Q1K2_METMZ|nr:Mobile element protein [Methanosarcina mazei Tuc01]
MTCCKECGSTLENVEVEAYERRQVFDIPPVNLIVTEHKSQIKTCPCCGKLNKAVFPESVKYPVQYGPNILASAIYCKRIILNKKGKGIKKKWVTKKDIEKKMDNEKRYREKNV